MVADIQKIYEGVMAIIENAKDLLDDSSVPDTDNMKREVERLCKAINDLPVQQRVAYAGELGKLFDALSALEKELKRKRDEVDNMLSDAPTHKAASKAYAKAEQIDKSKKKKKEDK